MNFASEIIQKEFKQSKQSTEYNLMVSIKWWIQDEERRSTGRKEG